MGTFEILAEIEQQIPVPVPGTGAFVYDLLLENPSYYDGATVTGVGERTLPRTFTDSPFGYSGFGPRLFFVRNELKVIRGYDVEGVIRPKVGATQVSVSFGIGYNEGASGTYVTAPGDTPGDEVISAHVPLRGIPLRRLYGGEPLHWFWDGLWIRLPQDGTTVTPAGFLTEFKMILDDPPEFTLPAPPPYIPTATPVQVVIHLQYPSGEPVVGCMMWIDSLDGGLLFNGVAGPLSVGPSDGSGDIVVDMLGTVLGEHTIRIYEPFQTGFSPSFKNLVFEVSDTGAQEFWTDLTGVR